MGAGPFGAGPLSLLSPVNVSSGLSNEFGKEARLCLLAANIAAGLAAWTRLLGLHDDEPGGADPGTLRYRIWHLPARLARHARQRVLSISPSWPWKEAFLACWQRLCALPALA
jgi:hypothetical protein